MRTFKFRLLVISPVSNPGSPVFSRISALEKVFGRHQITVINYNSLSPFSKLLMLFTSDLIFITMPPFRHWWLIFFWGYKIVLDWRDGWSIAMKSGYGNTVSPQRIKALCARMVELLAVFLSKKIFVCTQGLLNYHIKAVSSFFSRKFLLVTNGHNIDVDNNRFCNRVLRGKTKIRAICIGKFVEYGEDKARNSIETLLMRYPMASIEVFLFGCSIPDNSNFIEKFQSTSRLSFFLQSRLDYALAIDEVVKSDIALAIIRDPRYEYGTKVFDYIACGVPILNYLPFDNDFIRTFSGCFDTDYDPEVAYKKAVFYRRDAYLCQFDWHYLFAIKQLQKQY